jgi:serine protease Do
MTHRRSIAPMALILSAALATASCSSRVDAQSPPTASVPPQTSTSAPPLVRALPDFTQLVEAHGPSVVNVEVTRKAAENTGGQGEDPSEFFRRFGLPSPEIRPFTPQPDRAAGSGFIVSSDGYILTNAHVVDEADSVIVRLTDRREFQAKVIGHDARTDVAVLKIEAKNLPAVKIGSPSQLRPGDWVIAIGSPFGFESSVTAGIVSATSRSLPSGFVPFIQTDVAVNPGNSGGPLFNLRGEVVGVNSQIFSRTGGYMGVSFAIPIDLAMNVEQQLITTGRVVRGRIGVGIQDVNAQLAESFGLDRPRGALVSSVVQGAPAEKADIKPGDIILSVDGKPISLSNDLASLIANTKPGKDATLEVWRGRESKSVRVRVEELEEPATLRADREQRRDDDSAARLGLAVRPLTQEEKEQIKTSGSLAVEDVTGPAAAAGVRPGDIVLGVNGKRINSVEELRSMAKNAEKGKTLALLIQRQDAQIFVPLPVG